MTDTDDIMKLDNFDDEDIFDIVVKLEKSFGIRFEKDAFRHVKTFGDMCDVFEKYLNYEHREDCTKQQTFYRVRKAISATLEAHEACIKPDNKLIDLFPQHNRRQKAKEFKNYLGTDINILTYPDWLGLIFFIGFLLSFLAFFFDWKIALSGIAFFVVAIKIAEKFGKDLDLQTIRELTEKLSQEHYIYMRRVKGTINKQEVLAIIIETFSDRLAIDKIFLTRESKFSWAK